MDTNHTLLRNLLDRLERRPDGDGYTWSGVITEREVNALRSVCGLKSQETVDEISAPAVHMGESLSLSSQNASIVEEVTLCIDFGTAMSKAAAMRYDDDFLEVGLGAKDVPSGSGYPVHSSLFISGEKIWFGAEAIQRSEGESNLERKRFDSSKQEISQGNHNNFFTESVEKAINPTNDRMSKGDLIQLYLSFLIDLSSISLAKHGIDGLPMLRFTRPYLEESRARSTCDLLRRMLSHGRIMADTLHGSWADGIPIAKARALLDKLYEIDKPRGDDFLSLDILEATAAASGALRDTRPRRLVLVADIGAGTCDLGLFLQVGDRRIGQMANTTLVLRQAGDTIDDLLIEAVLDAAHIPRTDSEIRRRIITPLRREIRLKKEQLFRKKEKEVDFLLESDSKVTIRLDDFLSTPGVKNFAETFSSKVKECLEGQPLETYEHPDIRCVHVVITGGGASLPMIREAFAVPMDIHGKKIHFQIIDAQPKWLNDFPELIPVFPQMAVAIGGAQPDLPTEVKTISDMAPAPPGRRYIQTQYKGS